jgi:hypothetical protein
MSDRPLSARGAQASATLRKRAAHWRRVACLVTDAVLTGALRSRACALEREAAELDRKTREETLRKRRPW